MMSRILKLILFLVVAGFVGLVGFAYIGDLSPTQTDARQPVTLDVN